MKEKEKEKETKKIKSLSNEVIRNVTCMLLIVNIITISNIAYWVTYSLEKSEKQYMNEMILRLSTEVNYELQRYIDATQGISVNAIIVDYLENTDNVGIVQNNALEEPVRAELSIIANIFGDTILHVSAASVKSDNIIDNSGGIGGSNFSLKNTSYYSAITKSELVITSAYNDTTTGKSIITIAYPVFGRTGGVVGLVAVDLCVEKLSGFVTSTSFGDTGTTYILDSDYSVIVHPDPQMIGMSTGNVSYDGSDIQKELDNPSGQIIKYTMAGVTRMGGFMDINNADWLLVSAVDINDFYSRVQLIVGVLSLFQVILFAIGIIVNGRFIHRKLVPIQSIQNYVHEVSKGNLQAQLYFTSDDEMGALVNDIRTMVDTLKIYIGHVSKTIKDFADGKIQVSDDVEYIGDFITVHSSLHHFVDLMSNSLYDLKRAVEEVDSGSQQISTGAMELANGSQEQAMSVEGLSDLISHINEEIKETAKYSSKISGYASNIARDIEINNEKMQKLAIDVQEIKSHSDEVERIIKVIDEVAFQTNILALNAAVESARAGEAGRGFAIVADEVRNLSIKTTEAVQDTTRIITEMTVIVESSTNLANETSKDLQIIAEETQGFVENMASITHSTNDQSQSITKIHNGIETISSVIHNNAAISEESSASTEELSAQATLMTELISKFNIDKK